MQDCRAEVWQLVDSRGPGGIETHIGILAGALQAAGQPVRVLFLADHGTHPLHRTLAGHGVPFEVCGGARGLDTRLRECPPLLLHTHGYKAGILGRLLGRLNKVPMVSTYHAGEPGDGRLRFYFALDRAMARLCHPIAVSEAILSQLPGKARRIENFVAVPPEAPRGDPRAIAFVGRLSPEKGPDLFCRLAEDMPEAHFDLFGDGPMRSALQGVHGARVQFHGMVHDMPTRWSDIGLLCMTSRHEGLPLAALEAMANGVPVAAFGVGALPEVIRHGVSGLLAPPGDLPALERHLRSWLNAGAQVRAAMSAAARATIIERFSVEAGLAHVLEVYREALTGRGRAP
jgi:glycosyltransferase involved in cell wall biosynthesis